MFASPFLLLSEGQGLASGDVPTIIAGALAILLFALAYFFFAILGHRTRRSARSRVLATALIVYQLAAGAWLLSASSTPAVLIAAAPLLSVSVFLFMAFIWPGDLARNHRPMRQRDEIDEYQPR